MAQATAISPQALTNTAKALIQAYNDKDWDRVKAGITADFVYDEVPTGRKVTGIDATLEAWKGWAQAFPDSKGAFHGAHVAQDGIVVLESAPRKAPTRAPCRRPRARSPRPEPDGSTSRSTTRAGPSWSTRFEGWSPPGPHPSRSTRPPSAPRCTRPGCPIPIS